MTSFGASAAVGVITQNAVAGGEITYSKDLFGTASNAVVLTNGKLVDLDFTAIIAANEAELTYTLTNGSFGEAVKLTDFAGAVKDDITLQIISGGAVGDTSVTLKIVTAVDLTATETLTFAITKLKDVSALSDKTKKVTAVATIKATKDAGAVTFPNVIGDTGTALNIEIAGSGDAHSLVVVDGTGTNNGIIDIDKRETLTNGYAELAKVTAAIGGATKGIDGAAAFAYDAKDVLNVSVNGTFNTGDKVCLATDPAKLCADSTDTALTVTGGAASVALTGPAAIAVDKSLTYVPNGTDTLAPATFTSAASVAWNTATNVASTDTGTQSTNFSGLSVGKRVLAIGNKDNAETNYIRVTNDTNTDGSVFAQMFAQDGTDMGFKELGTVKAQATVVYTAATLETLFGAWTGKARITLSTSKNVLVQPTVRSNGVSGWWCFCSVIIHFELLS